MALAACTAGGRPTTDDVLVVDDRSFPGAVETDRSWREEDTGRNVDGGRIDVPARLSIEYSLDRPQPPGDVLDFYEFALTDEGWELVYRDNDSLNARFRDDGRGHGISIRTAAGAATDSYTLYYTISTGEP